MSALAQKLPPLMHFPLAKHLATTQGRSIRRVGWTGEPGAYEPTWIRYTGGLWWYQNASGERVAESGDVDEHQDAGLPADAAVFGIRPYDLWDDMGMDAGLRDLANPNAETGAAACASPAIMPPSRPGVVVFAPVVDPPSEELGGGGGESATRSSGVRSQPPLLYHLHWLPSVPPKPDRCCRVFVMHDPGLRVDRHSPRNRKPLYDGRFIELGLDEWDGVPIGAVTRPQAFWSDHRSKLRKNLAATKRGEGAHRRRTATTL